MSDIERLRHLPSDPKCPACGRGYPIKTRKKGHQRLSFFCDPSRDIGGCGREWDAK